MEIRLPDSVATLRISRWLLVISLAGGVAIVGVPLPDGSERPVKVGDGETVAGSVRSARPLRLETSDDDQSAIDRDPFAATLEATRKGRESPAPNSPPSTVGSSGTAVAAPVVLPQLLGTIIDRLGGSVAICTLGSSAPKSVRVGGRIGGYRVDSISPGIAVVIDSSGRPVILRLRLRS